MNIRQCSSGAILIGLVMAGGLAQQSRSDELAELRKTSLAVSQADEQSHVVVLRPLARRLHISDPVPLVLHWEQIDSEGQRVPVRVFMETRATLDSLAFHVTAPNGTTQELTVDSKAQVKGLPATWYMPTLMLALTTDGLQFESPPWNLSGEVTVPWAEDAKLDMSQTGFYAIKVCGRRVHESESAEFSVGPVSVERGAMGVLPEAKLAELALKQIAADAEKEIPLPKKGANPWVYENQSGQKIVLLVGAEGKGWSQDRYYAVLNSEGQRIATMHKQVGTCVAEGVVVDAERGRVPIEQLKAGDRVWGFDFAANRRALVKVTTIRSHVAPRALQLGELRVTENHPVYSNGTYRPASEIKPGDTLLSGSEMTSAGKASIVEGPVAVYDLTVDKTHNYFAGGVLVHNKDRDWWPHVDDAFYLLWPTDKYQPMTLGKGE